MVATEVAARLSGWALLKTFGFTQFQLAAAVSGQAAVAAVIGIVLGVPIGIIVGRWLRILFARAIFAVPSPAVPVPAVPVPAVAVLAVGTLILAVVRVTTDHGRTIGPSGDVPQLGSCTHGPGRAHPGCGSRLGRGLQPLG
jgi:predicted lysophospholipase L1 biosynthesis ABC-type transport system permease subunit